MLNKVKINVFGVYLQGNPLHNSSPLSFIFWSLTIDVNKA